MHLDLVDALAIGSAFATSCIVVYTLRHIERRVQHLEHEVASLHANAADVSGDLRGVPEPTTPEVSRRYAEMKAA